jgi:hypothetical protein
MPSNLPATKKTLADLPFRTRQDAVKAIQDTTLTDATVTLLTNSTEYQAFVKTLADIRRPIGIVVVLPRD